MKKVVKGTRTIYTAEYGDTHDFMGKEYPSRAPQQDIDFDNVEVKDSLLPFHLRKRERLKHCLLQIRCFLGDKTAFPSDAQIETMSFKEVENTLSQAGQQLSALWKTQKERQRKREENSFELGVKRYRESILKRQEQGQATDDAPGEALIRKYAEPLKDAIINYTLHTKSGGANYYAESVRFISTLDPAVAAYITTRIVLANCFSGIASRSFTDIHDEVAKWVEAESLAEDTLAAARRRPEAQYQEALRRHAAATTTKELEAARKRIARWKKKLGVVSAAYSEEDRDRGGLVLIRLLLESNPNAFFKTFTTIGRRTYTVIAPTPRLVKEMQQAHLDRSKLFPVDRPMIYPPFPWENARGFNPRKPGLPPGGYRFDGRKPRLHGPVNMIKTTEKEGLRRLEEILSRQDADAEIITGAVNALQDTPFRINRDVFTVMDAVVNAENYSAFKLPELREPADTAPYMERLLWWRTGRAKATVFFRQYSDAKDDLKEPMLFFPHTFDFRGRVYPMGGPLNPQGDDRAKALLEFAEGRRMGEHPDAGKWLSIHGANCWGLDKESIADRIAWVNDPDNQKDIVDAAGNPLDCRRWLSAEKPWPFLAFCFEWAQYLKYGADHITHLPVFVDGTCNGSQHMAALMRCKATGQLVGLCKAGEDEKPADLYQTVADAVNARIDADVKRGNHDAIRIREIESGEHNRGASSLKKPFVSRRLAKGPVMTYGYGITDRGMKDDIAETLFEWRRDGDISNEQWEILCPKRDPEEKKEGAGPFWKTVVYLADAFEKAIEEKAVASGQIMNWLKASAETAAARKFTTKNGKTRKKGTPISWLSPVGFPVYYAKYTKAEKRLQCYIFPNATAAKRKIKRGGQYAEVNRTYYDKSKIHIGDTGRGLPPDMIHSLDAAHMMKTIDYCQRRGVRSFAMIHDSYGTHATTMAVMAEELRRAFVDMYKTVDIHWIARSLQEGAISVQVAELAATEKGESKTTDSQDWFNYYVPQFPDIATADTLDIDDVLDATYFFA